MVARPFLEAKTQLPKTAKRENAPPNSYLRSVSLMDNPNHIYVLALPIFNPQGTFFHCSWLYRVNYLDCDWPSPRCQIKPRLCDRLFDRLPFCVICIRRSRVIRAVMWYLLLPAFVILLDLYEKFGILKLWNEGLVHVTWLNTSYWNNGVRSTLPHRWNSCCDYDTSRVWYVVFSSTRIFDRLNQRSSRFKSLWMKPFERMRFRTNGIHGFFSLMRNLKLVEKNL